MGFIEATRQNILPLTTLAYTAGQEVGYDISRVGFLAKVKLRFSGTLNAKHASKTTFTKAPGAPFNLANRVKLFLNNNTTIWDTSGVGAYWQNIINKNNYRLDEIIGSSKVFRFGNTVSSGGTDNNINFELDLNVCINDRDLIGLLMLQSSQVVATVRIDNAQPSVLCTDTDITMTLTGSWYISIEYFDIPSNTADWPVLTTVHSVTEDQSPINSTGANRFVIPRGNTYMRIINSVILNGSPNCDDVERMTIKYNLSNEPYNMTGVDMLALQRSRYGRDLPTGVFVWDFFYQGDPNLGNHRDFIFSGNVTELDQYLHIASGATLGTSNNKLVTVRDMLLDVQTA